MPYFMVLLIPDINLINLSWVIKCLFFRNMEPLKYFIYSVVFHIFRNLVEKDFKYVGTLCLLKNGYLYGTSQNQERFPKYKKGYSG